MSVNGILEGYLTIYGWEVYTAIFLLLVAVGAVLYPVARVLFDIAITYAEGGSTPETGARALIMRLTIYFLVLVLGLIPIAPVEVSSTSVQNRCGREALQVMGDSYPALTDGDFRFTRAQQAYAPLLPYLAMVLASGFNAVLYEATPCLHDLTNLNLAMNTLDFSASEKPNELRSNVERFEQECGATARRIALDFLSGVHGTEGRAYMEGLLDTYAQNTNGKRQQSARQKQLVYFGSKFYREVFYKPCTSSGDINTPAGRLCIMTPLRAQQPVSGFPYNPSRDSDVSRYQAATGQGLPTCEEWWSDSEQGLRAQLLKASKPALKKTMNTLDRSCMFASGVTNSICVNTIRMLPEPELADTMVEQMLLAGKRQLSTQTQDIGWGAALVAGGLFAFTDVAQNIAAQAAGYLMTIYFMKIGSSLLQPFVLMTVFILWGLFLVIGEMRGMALIKGMLLIFVLSILPSLWSFADYIDDQLFLALYPGASPITVASIPLELFEDHSTIERILLTFTTLVFYIVFPLLMLYLVAEAGGPSQGGTIGSAGINSPAREQGSVAGSSVSGSSVRPGVKSWAAGKMRVAGKMGGGKQ